jgi:hypothetical protein
MISVKYLNKVHCRQVINSPSFSMITLSFGYEVLNVELISVLNYDFIKDLNFVPSL